jgi:hypothetical protein
MCWQTVHIGSVIVAHCSAQPFSGSPWNRLLFLEQVALQSVKLCIPACEQGTSRNMPGLIFFISFSYLCSFGLVGAQCGSLLRSLSWDGCESWSTARPFEIIQIQCDFDAIALVSCCLHCFGFWLVALVSLNWPTRNAFANRLRTIDHHCLVSPSAAHGMHMR